jgi:hypothetical protein
MLCKMSQTKEMIGLLRADANNSALQGRCVGVRAFCRLSHDCRLYYLAITHHLNENTVWDKAQIYTSQTS